MDFKKIIVLENDNEQDAENDREGRVIRKSFHHLPVEHWYRFMYSFTKYDGQTGQARMVAVEEDTLLLTYTTFANGVMSGYGDLIGMWVKMFHTMAVQGKRLNICVICVPPIKWQLIDWVLKGGTKTERKKREAMVVDCLTRHNLYSLYFNQDEFSEAVQITPEWWEENFYPMDSKIINEGGLLCDTGYLYGGDYTGDPIYYNLDVPVSGKPTGYTTSGCITLDKLKELNPRKIEKSI